jgi:sugar phosphate permease
MSLINVPWQLYVIYGIIIGTGAGFGFVPVTSTVSRWFVEKRGLALGITVAGIGIGTLVMAPFAQFLIFKFDWRTSYLFIAALLLIIGLPVSQLMRLHPSEKGLVPYGTRKIGIGNKETDSPLLNTTDFSFRQAINTKAFWLLCIMYMFLVFSVQMMMVHLKAHAVDLGVAEMAAATTIGIIGGSSILGRITMGSLSDRIGRKTSLFIAYLFMAIAMLWLLKATQLWQLYLFSAIFGFGYGSNVPLFPAVTADWFGTKAHGIIFGAVSVAGGIGGALGPPLAGYVFDTFGYYDIAFIVSAVLLFMAAICSFLIRMPYQGLPERRPPL